MTESFKGEVARVHETEQIGLIEAVRVVRKRRKIDKLYALIDERRAGPLNELLKLLLAEEEELDA